MSRPKRISPKDIADEAKSLTLLIKNYLGSNPGDTRESMAIKFGIKSKGAIVYQHMNGYTPISMDAGISYSNGFGVPLSTVSKRLAIEANKRMDAIKGDELPIDHVINGLSPQELRLIDVFRSLPTDSDRSFFMESMLLKVNDQTNGKGLTPGRKVRNAA